MQPSSSWRASSVSSGAQSPRVGVTGAGTSTRRSTTWTAERPDAAARICSYARRRQLAEHQRPRRRREQAPRVAAGVRRTPRPRGRLWGVTERTLAVGRTPASAGTTLALPLIPLQMRRGPPRPRGRLTVELVHPGPEGRTPASAGTTRRCRSPRRSRWEDPPVRGSRCIVASTDSLRIRRSAWDWCGNRGNRCARSQASSATNPDSLRRPRQMAHLRDGERSGVGADPVRDDLGEPG